jgi:hypothetical protein
MKLSIVAALVFLLNIPFGHWRARCRKFSWQWLLAVHAPVPAVIALRLASGIGFQLISYSALVGAFFLGQRCGALIRLRPQRTLNARG